MEGEDVTFTSDMMKESTQAVPKSTLMYPLLTLIDPNQHTSTSNLLLLVASGAVLTGCL